jgi:hypothetical protein
MRWKGAVHGLTDITAGTWAQDSEARLTERRTKICSAEAVHAARHATHAAEHAAHAAAAAGERHAAATHAAEDFREDVVGGPATV